MKRSESAPISTGIPISRPTWHCPSLAPARLISFGEAVRMPPLLLAAAVLQAESETERLRLLRAFHFQQASKATDQALLSLFDQGPASVAVPVAFMLGASQIKADLERAKKARHLIHALRGEPELVRLVAHLELDGTEKLLAEFVESQGKPSGQTVLAARTLLRNMRWLEARLAESEAVAYERLMRSLGASGEATAVTLLMSAATDPKRDLAVRQKLVEALALSSRGEQRLLEAAESGELPEDLEFTTAALLGRSRDRHVRENITKHLQLPPTPGAEKFPPIPQLVQVQGNHTKGAEAFAKATCATCHLVDGEGIDFGPDLTEIGDKLSVEGMYEAILYPNNSISHGFHGVVITQEDDTQYGGYIVSETDQSVSLRMPGGVTQEIASSEIKKREEMEQSLMPPGLAAILATQELADLVAYLRSLKKAR